MPRITYSPEQKANAITRVSEIGVAAASKELGISVNTLRSWTKPTTTKKTKTTKATKAVKVSTKKDDSNVNGVVFTASQIIKLVEENTELKKELANIKSELSKLIK